MSNAAATPATGAAAMYRALVGIGVVGLVAGLALVSGARVRPNNVSAAEPAAEAGRLADAPTPGSPGVPAPAENSPDSESP